MSLSRAPARDTSETPSPRERIRSHMKMVISQLEGILIELKDVAKELREVRSFYIVFFFFFEGEGGRGRGLVGGVHFREQPRDKEGMETGGDCWCQLGVLLHLAIFN